MTKVTVHGLRELDRALEQLPKSTGKSVLRRVMKKRAQPLADDMRRRAPVDPTSPGDLQGSIDVSTKLSKRQRKQHRRMFRNEKAAVELFVGPGPDPAAWNQEFGNVNHGPQSFARPAWDANRTAMLEGIKDDLWREVEKSAKRLAKKQAKLAATG